jgi:hypothetical protein
VGQWHGDYCHNHPVLGQRNFNDTITSIGTVAQLLVTIIQYWDSGTVITVTITQYWDNGTLMTRSPVLGQWHSDYCHDHPVLGQWHFPDTFTLYWDSGTVITVTITQHINIH